MFPGGFSKDAFHFSIRIFGRDGTETWYTSRFVRVILAQGPCYSSLYRSNFNGWPPRRIQKKKFCSGNCDRLKSVPEMPWIPSSPFPHFPHRSIWKKLSVIPSICWEHHPHVHWKEFERYEWTPFFRGHSEAQQSAKQRSAEDSKCVEVEATTVAAVSCSCCRCPWLTDQGHQRWCAWAWRQNSVVLQGTLLMRLNRTVCPNGLRGGGLKFHQHKLCGFKSQSCHSLQAQLSQMYFWFYQVRLFFSSDQAQTVANVEEEEKTCWSEEH